MGSDVTPEDIILEIGGCGRFQVALSFLVHIFKIAVCWSEINIMYSMKTPKWWCIDGIDFDNYNTSLASFTEEFLNSSRTETCIIANNTKCSEFHFDPYIKTVINQFDLICDLAWIPATIASVQMGGEFVGNILSGHIADAIGRKKPFFLSLLLMAICNIAGSFSTSWVMFAVFHFFIGAGKGFFLTIQYSLLSEFTLARWRSWVIGFPSWQVEACLFALTAWGMRNWKHIQLMTGLMAIPCMAAWWFVQESFRWYISHDRNGDAANVIKFVAKTNKHPLEELTHLNLQEVQKRDTNTKLTVLALFQTRHLTKITCLSICNWFALGLVGYGIQFGIPSLSGNIFINLFLYALLGMPSKLLSIYLQNSFGRKASIMIINGIIAIGAIIAGVLHYVETDIKSELIIGFTLICSAFNSAAWVSIQTITIEMYPTAIRNIGFGFLSICTRVGSIIGPQFVFLSTIFPGLLYFVSSGISVICVLLTTGLPETKSANLKDKIKEINKHETEDISMEIQHFPVS